jgi:hypothetical protein
MVDKTADQFVPRSVRRDALPRGPRAVCTHYDQPGAPIVWFQTGVEIGFAPPRVPRLRTASASVLEGVALEAFGISRHYGAPDADLYGPSSVKGILGSRRSVADHRGALGCHARGPAEAAAPRAKGRCVGWPGPMGA